MAESTEGVGTEIKLYFPIDETSSQIIGAESVNKHAGEYQGSAA